MHSNTSHQGISNFRILLNDRGIYLVGLTFLIEYTVNNCVKCAQEHKNVLRPEKPGIILTYYPKQHFVMDITYLNKELLDKNENLYLFNIIDHFSKYGMSYLINNKSSEAILEKLKLALQSNGIPKEIGCDNGREFRNNQIENYLKENNIKIVHGIHYNQHSQGVVERYHVTI